MADTKTEAAKAEEARRAALTQEQRDEEDRRAKLSQAERDAEDLAALDAQIAAENAAKGQPLTGASAAAQRQALVNRMKAAAKKARDKAATEEVVVARGRSIFLEADQEQPFTAGQKILVTPEEAAKLRAAGHIASPDGTVVEPVGPKVYQEAGLLVGHAAGQGAEAPKGGKAK